jgi:hypothetical protein
MAIPDQCDRCAKAARLVQRDLAAIGIGVTIRQVADVDRALRRGARFDLLDRETQILYPDAASFLQRVIRDIPRRWVERAVQTRMERVARLSGNDRQTAAAALADGVTARYLNNLVPRLERGHFVATPPATRHQPVTFPRLPRDQRFGRQL